MSSQRLDSRGFVRPISIKKKLSKMRKSSSELHHRRAQWDFAVNWNEKTSQRKNLTPIQLLSHFAYQSESISAWQGGTTNQ